MRGLLVIERFILESLNKSAKNLIDLERDTHLNKELLLNLFSDLSAREIIFFKEGKYFLNQNKKHFWSKEINDAEAKKEEMKELMATLINMHFSFKSSLKMKKVRLTSFDEKVLTGYFKQIDDYLTNLNNTEKTIEIPISEQRLFVWGEGNYGQVVRESMSLT